MRQPEVQEMSTGARIPFTDAPDEALRACLAAGPEEFLLEPGDPANSVAIDKAIAAKILEERESEAAGKGAIK